MSELFATERLYVRSWRLEDAEEFFAFSQDQGLNSNAISKDQWRYRQASLTAAQEKITAWFTDYKNCGVSVFPVFLKATNELCGLCGIKPIHPDGESEPSWELMYRFPAKHWGKGFATEVAAGVIEFGFSHVGLETITAGVLPENEASKNVLRKLKFPSVRPIAILGVAGELFSITRSEWSLIRTFS